MRWYAGRMVPRVIGYWFEWVALRWALRAKLPKKTLSIWRYRFVVENLESSTRLARNF